MFVLIKTSLSILSATRQDLLSNSHKEQPALQCWWNVHWERRGGRCSHVVSTTTPTGLGSSRSNQARPNYWPCKLLTPCCRGGMTQLTYRHWSRAISAVPHGPPPHQRSRIRLQCGGGARSQWLCALWGTSSKLPTAVRSYYSYSISDALFVRIRIDYSDHYSGPKRIFGTALVFL